MSGRDPYRYFRVEAHDLIAGLVEGVMRLERERAGQDLERLLRMAHTLKGAARVVRQAAIGDLAHKLEDLLGAHREDRAPLAPGDASAMLALLDHAQALLARLDGAPTEVAPTASPPQPTATVAPEPGPAPEQGAWSRVETAGLADVVRSVAEATLASGRLSRRLETTPVARLARHLEAGLSAADDGVSALAKALIAEVDNLLRTATSEASGLAGKLASLEGAARELVLMPAQLVFAPLERAVRDAATTMGREVTFEARGGEIKVESKVMAAAREALLHVVRNAIAHGIEPPMARLAAGKPAAGRVTVSVTRRSGRVRFEVRDDGRGLDLPAIARTAVARGLLSPDAASSLDAAGAAELLLARAFSTRGHTDQLAGRGLGLDAAREAARSVGGSLAMTPGAPGLIVTLDLPVSRSAFSCLVVEAAGQKVAVPMDAVVRALPVQHDSLVRGAGRLELYIDGTALPFAPLSHLLGAPGRGDGAFSLLIEAERTRACLGVERLLGQRTVLGLTLPDWLALDPLVAGAWLDEQGVTRLVLDPGALIAASANTTLAPTTPRAREVVLVVDDSLTTRMLEKSILEAAGYEVDLAVSAEDGLVKARQRRYDAFVVDVEMPGMDGYGFTRTIGQDPRLKDTPVILVTSRGSAEDRRRGVEAGARAHIAKGEFDQRRLLETMRSLMGAA